MATLRGNARRGVELVIVEYPNCYSKDNTLAFLNVMAGRHGAASQGYSTPGCAAPDV